MSPHSPVFVDPARVVAGRTEAHRLVASGSGVALALQFEHVNDRCGFQTAAFGLPTTTGPRPLPVVISALDIDPGSTWELRTSGLWAEQVLERSFEHWSYGLEAFALAIDEPDELVRRAYGHRVPLGWELDFVADGAPEATTCGEQGSFTQTGTIDGILLTRDDEWPISGPARRSYWIGDRSVHTDVDTLSEHSRSEPGSVVLPTGLGPWTVSPPTPSVV